MPNFETKTNPREDFDKNEEDVESIKAQFASAKSSEEMMALAKKMQELEGNKNEMVGNAQEEAEKENEQRDLGAEMAKDKEAEILAAKELADLKLKDAAESAKKAEALLQRIKGEVSVEKTEPVAVENVGQAKEIGQKDLIEQIGAPKSEMFEKYGEKMRQAADDLVENRKAIEANEEARKKVEYGTPEWQKLWDEGRALNDRRNELASDAAWGSNVVKFREEKSNESWTSYGNYKSEELRQYRSAALDDPYVVLRMVEAGALGIDARGDGLAYVSERLMGNSEFVREAFKLAKKHEAGYSGWFWNNVTGEARRNKELYIEAIKTNHLNYQFGSNEFKKDPEVQRVALESGLNPVYLFKG